jgi:hypothetical protein
MGIAMKTEQEHGIYFTIEHKITTFKAVKTCENKACKSNMIRSVVENYCTQCGVSLILSQKESVPRYQYASEVVEFAKLGDINAINDNFESTNEQFYNFNCILPQFNDSTLKGASIIDAINSFDITAETYRKLKKTYGDKLSIFCGDYETFS